MATYKGVNRTLADTPEGSNIMDPGVQKGKLRTIMDTYEALAAASGSIIEMGEYLPKGARVVEVCLMADALGGSSTLKVGDYEDDDRYIEVSSTWNTNNQVQRLNAIAGRQYKVDETTEGATSTDRQVIITTGGAAITGTIKIEVTYVQE
jgi:hypothetical protein